ncbi:MAG TPA: sulfotransferase [Rhizomicrobium sp.]
MPTRPCFLIARPRSGATVFNRMLRTHPKVFGLGEIFNESNPLSYFQFMRRVVSADPDSMLPSRSVQNFIRYVQWCGERAREKSAHCEVMILNVKYDQAHLVYDSWWKLGSLPRLFYLITEKKWNVIDIHRRDPVRLCISNQVAIQTKVYHSNALQPGQTISAKVHIDPDILVKDIAATNSVYNQISGHFAGKKEYLGIYYEDMFADDTGKKFSQSLISSVSKFLGLPNRFDEKPSLEKLLREDAFSYLENEQEIRTALEQHGIHRQPAAS